MTLTLDAPRPTTANLLPALFARSWIKHQRLSDDGFCDSLATIQLSPNLLMALVFPGQRTFRRLSHRGLADLDVSARQAWNFASQNLQRAALDSQGLRFWTRPAGCALPAATPYGGLQVRSHGAPIYSWLAHPETFTVLDKHMRRLMRSHSLTYLVPDSATLFVFSHLPDAYARDLARAAAEQLPHHRTVLHSRPLVWSNGFPREL
ncbi:hypothetical protein [Corynebacterium macginleyi]|uniref:hypothetical protein n=1 Tax=Corynebacterium macginleyi TaxID=38290 RepID=UPI00190C008C|nr:hypothetical protein [Corynebacterium macginleyi]MBK4151461.1 hypothetical protein [Corynebacterium macginleyi]